MIGRAAHPPQRIGLVRRTVSRCVGAVQQRLQQRRYVPLYKLWRSWDDEITLPGKLLIGGILAAGVGTVTVQIPVYQIFCGLTVLLLVALGAGFLYVPRVSISGRLPDRVAAGNSIAGRYVVTNRGRFRPIYDLGVGYFELTASIVQPHRERTVMRVGPRESIELDVVLQPLRRGSYRLPPLRAWTTFPFNLFRIGLPGRGRAESLLVLPAFHPLTTIDVPIGTRYQPGGIALTSNIGESPEYIGNREYVPGEPARRLDFRSWARLGKPVVREYQEEYYCRIALILDTLIPPGMTAPPGGFANLEAAVSLAASIADVLSGGEYLIDLFAAGPELYVFRAGRHMAHFDNILEILACVDACRDDPFERIAPAVADELENISTAICVLLDWDASRQHLVRTIRESGCSLKILIVRDVTTTLPIDEYEADDITTLTPQQIQRGGIDQL